MPTLPPWDALHPVAVHFPVAYLAIAPLFTLACLLLRGHRREWLHAALLVALLGALGATVAEMTGEEAEHRVELSAAAEPVLEQHEEQGERIPPVAWGLAAALAAVALAARLGRLDLGRSPVATVLAVILLLQIASAAFVAQTAHLGGRLVYEFDVRAPWPASGASESSK